MKLFEPVRLGSMELKNRIVFPPILTKYATEDGFATDQLIAFYRERARGGAGLIIVESAYVDPGGKFARKMLGIDEDRFLPGLERLTKRLRFDGTKVALELFHAGRQTSPKVCGTQPVSPSGLTCPVTGERPRVLTTGEIELLIDQYAESARRARDAGFDAVELDGGYGHLISQFLSPCTNRRTDRYGGDRNGRIRFVREIIERTGAKVGREFPILFRLNGDDLLPGGVELKESREIAKALESFGVCGLDIVAGMHEARKDMEYFSNHSASPGSPRGVWISLAAGIKEVVSIPVIAGGRINEAHLAEEVLQKGQADLIALGRPLIADPEFPQKAARGKAEEIRLCVGCGTCQKRDLKTGLAWDVTCLVNPAAGREEIFSLEAAPSSKRVVVVGGGAGGMEAARVASLRGHRVTLYEKENVLGGQLLLGSAHPLREEMGHLIDYLKRQMERLSVEVRLGQEVTPESVRSLEFDALILATGARPIRPRIRGIDHSGVVFAHQVFAGEIPSGEKIVICGGGLVGVEAADLLGSRGKAVTLVEMLDLVMADEGTFFRPLMLHRLQRHGTTILTRTTVKEVRGKSVVAEREGETISLEADHFVVAVGYQSNRELYDELKNSIAPERIFLIGDGRSPRKAVEAMLEGHQAGLSICPG